VAGTKDKIWNGGVTKPNGYISKEEAKIFRQQEDYYDVTDSELEFREDLVKREKLMKEQEKQNSIRSKFAMFNVREQINKMMDKPCTISHGEPRNRYRRPEGSQVGVNEEK